MPTAAMAGSRRISGSILWSEGLQAQAIPTTIGRSDARGHPTRESAADHRDVDRVDPGNLPGDVDPHPDGTVQGLTSVRPNGGVSRFANSASNWACECTPNRLKMALK